MVTISTFKKLALSFYEVTEQPHFEKTSFRVNKKIFATLDIKNNNAVLKFSEVDQSAFSAYDMAEIYPVNGAWGKQGWTIVNLKKISKERLLDALTTSYCTVAPKKLAEKYKQP